MSNKKLSGAQLRKRKREQEADAKKYAVTAAKDLCEKLGIRVEGRIRRRKQTPGENARDAGLSAVEEITRIMKSVIDRLIQEITTRFGRLKTLDEKFGFLFDINKLFASDTEEMIFDSTVPHWQTFMKLILMELNCLQKSVTAICC
jgi:hypothetical protein